MADTKNVTLQQPVMLVLFVLIVAAICIVPYAHADSDDSHYLANRKLKELQPNDCADLGQFCSLTVWCCYEYKCRRNYKDWTGYCVAYAHGTLGQDNSTVHPAISTGKAGNTESQGIHMVVSS